MREPCVVVAIAANRRVIQPPALLRAPVLRGVRARARAAAAQRRR